MMVAEGSPCLKIVSPDSYATRSARASPHSMGLVFGAEGIICDELGRAGAEERDFGFARGRAREQGLSRAWRSGEQDTFRSSRTQAPIFLRAFQEVDDLVDFCLHLVNPGDIVERDTDRLPINALLFPAAQEAAHRALLASEHPT